MRFTATKSNGAVVEVTLDCPPYASVKAEDIRLAAAALANLTLVNEVWGAEAVEVEAILRALVAPAPASTKPPLYEGLGGGVKRHLKTGALYAEGFVVAEVELSPPTTAAKPKSAPTLRERVATHYGFPSRKWRQYKLP